MRIELLLVPDCPNGGKAAGRLRLALDEVGLSDATFTTRVIATQAEAQAAGFGGSPTILIDGRDPFAPPGAVPALACRLYRTEHGTDTAPDLAQLRRALRDADPPGVG
ncbi:hypothetical protein KGA66_16275 [Actinocrinis puniceicyclus]|uniref:Alkylmercury lyase n=1 Tax=Actinocrinis puniceicyclus TaxID=977794 RepID=A0A8J8BFC3_9ACTN|nr:DsbA family protein [Actinocrinis puniceicyclus]MBS2964614.1 hypothetical protein [Actinocrinis puniceicyclus]